MMKKYGSPSPKQATRAAMVAAMSLLLSVFLWAHRAESWPLVSDGAKGVADPAEQVVHPEAAPGPLDNPLKGWCTYTMKQPTQPYSMVYRYVSWKELEPEEGHYRFDVWEKKSWEEPLARGKHIVFRVFLDYPSTTPGSSGVPDWLLAKGVKTTHYTDYGGGDSPDYNDPRLIAGLERLLVALGKRYDTHPRIAFIEMGMLGFWGEWHTYPHNELFASAATQQRILDAAHRAFPNKMVMTRNPGAYAGKAPWLGYFDDMFPADTDGPEAWKFLPTMRRAGRSDIWKQAAIGGEMEPGAAKKWLGASFAETMREVEAAHFTWVGPYNPALEVAPDPEYTVHCQAMVRRMGYEFALKEIRHARTLSSGSRLKIRITGENQGVAPFYYPWAVKFALLDSQREVVEILPTSADIRTWQPGSFHLEADPPVHARPGRYTLALGIEDPWTHKPAIAFANALPRHEDWTLISTVEIVGKVSSVSYSIRGRERE